MKIVINGEVAELPGGSGGGESAGEAYSTEETRIGTWIDGKPLYRKVLVLDAPGEIGKDEVLYTLQDTTILQRIDAYATYIGPAGTGRIAIPYYYSADTNYTFWVWKNQISARISNSTHLGGKITFILEYTKTTD